jgi:hypothetical protein
MAILAGKAMLVRFVFARLALSLGGMRTAATAAGPAMGFLARMAVWVGRVLSFVPVVLGYVGRALLVIGRVLMFTPWGRAIGLLATAAVMIYRNWDGIKGGLIAIWEQLSGATAAWWARTTAGAAALWQTLVSLKDRFFTAGGDLMDGLVNGITSRVQMVRSVVRVRLVRQRVGRHTHARRQRHHPTGVAMHRVIDRIGHRQRLRHVGQSLIGAIGSTNGNADS